VVSMFASVRSASRSTAGVASLSDNGRFALNLLEQSVRSAGAMGCNSTLRQVSNLNAGASPIYTDYTEALAGYEATNTGPTATVASLTTAPAADTSAGDWTTTAALGAQLDALLVGKAVKYSDVLVVHETLPGFTPHYLTANAIGAATLVVNSTTGFASGQIGIVSDCTSSVVFQLGAPGGTTVPLGAGNASATLPVTYLAGAQVSVANTTVYYVGVGSDGDGALFVTSTNGTNTFSAPVEVVPDIENMQILYGIDTTGLQAATQYVTADQVVNSSLTNFNGVVSIKVGLLSASPANVSAVTPPTAAPSFNVLGTTVKLGAKDNRLRQVYTTTISTRNTTT